MPSAPIGSTWRTQPAEPRPKACAACGTVFACGPGTGEASAACWCQDLPPLPEIDPTNDCYCPACLKALIAGTG